MGSTPRSSQPHDWRQEVRRGLAARDATAAPLLDASALDARIDELAEHLEDSYDAQRRAGLSPDEAYRAALAELDDLDGRGQLKVELQRSARTPTVPPRSHSPVDEADGGWLAGTWSDLSSAARALMRSPGFTLATILTVALTTGPTTAALGMANWLFLAPVPGVAAPDRLATINFGVPSDNGGYTVASFTYDHMNALTDGSPSIEAMSGFQLSRVSLSNGIQPARAVFAEFVSADYLHVLGVRFLAGRNFLPEEDLAPHGTPVVVLGAPAAASLFPEGDAVGRTVRINDQAFIVTGVVATEFFGSQRVSRTALWLPGMTYRPVNHFPPDSTYPQGQGPFRMTVARLAPGASFEQASAELLAAADTLAAEDPTARKFETVRPMLDEGFADVQSQLVDPIVPLLAVGGILLLLGTANLANLFAFRSARHLQESAVRRALGASTFRLARPLIFEALLVSTIGGLTGLAFALLLQTSMGLMLTGTDSNEIPLTWRLPTAALGLAMTVGFLLSILPTRVALRADLGRVLGRSGRGTTRLGTGLRTGLAAAQLALSMTLLIGALLFVGTLNNLRNIDTGFNPDGLMTFQFEFRLQGYTPEQVRTFYDALTTTLSPQPGMQAVAIASGTPQFGGDVSYQVHLPNSPANDPPYISVSEASSAYFEALGLQFVAGGRWPAGEGPNSDAQGIVINESLAAQAFGSATAALGQPLHFAGSRNQPARSVPVVGVVRDVKQYSLRSASDPAIYRPTSRWSASNQFLIVRSSLPAAEAIQRVRLASNALDPALPLTPTLMTDRLDTRVGTERLLAWTMGVLAGLGFLIAAVGLYGLISQTVVERLREFGIRLAVGAGRHHVVLLVLRSALRVVVLGAPAGLALAAVGTMWVRGLLFGIAPTNPIVYLGALGALAAVVLLASLIPAWLASRSNPVDVLRAE